MGTKNHKAKKVQAGEYEYRGYTIRRNENVKAGYHGAWTVWGDYMLSGYTMKECKKNVDRRIEYKETHPSFEFNTSDMKKKAQAFMDDQGISYRTLGKAYNKFYFENEKDRAAVMSFVTRSIDSKDFMEKAIKSIFS
jgi:hypothetical protein